MAQNPFDQFDAPASTTTSNPFDQFDKVNKPKTGVVRGAGDVALRLGQGALIGTKGIADAFGARNTVSDLAQSGVDKLEEYISPAAKEQAQENAAMMQEAEGKGAIEQIKAAGKSFLNTPLDTVAQGFGTAVPIVAGALGAAAASPALATAAGAGAVTAGLGGAMGAGIAKSSIYDAVEKSYTDAGYGKEDAAKLASEAQSYTGKNTDQIALGAGLGAIAGRTGIEGVLVGNKPTGNLIRRTIGTAAAEGIPEAIQGGQERFASNTALNREGFNVDPMTGVIGQATLEGISGGAMGAATGALAGGGDKLVVDQSGMDADAELAAKKQAEYDAQQQASAAPTDEFTEFVKQADADIERRKVNAGIKKPAEAIPASDILGDENVSDTPNATTELANDTIASASDNPQGGVGDLPNQSNVSGFGDATGTLTQSEPSNVATGTGGDANNSLDRPFASATDDFLPKMRGMATDQKVIAQIDEELKLRGIANVDSVNTPAERVDGNAKGVHVGEKINKEWTAFSPESGTLNIPRSEMPQVKAEHRGAMVNFLNARGVDHTQETVPASSLKPTQQEFSEAKVKKASKFAGGDRSILVSADNHVLDGHHQWLSKLNKGDNVDVIRLNAPIAQLLDDVKEFPSSTVESGAAEAAKVADPKAVKPLNSKFNRYKSVEREYVEGETSPIAKIKNEVGQFVDSLTDEEYEKLAAMVAKEPYAPEQFKGRFDGIIGVISEPEKLLEQWGSFVKELRKGSTPKSVEPKQAKPKLAKPAKPKTLLATLRDLGGIKLSEKQDVTGEVKGFAPGGYNQVFKQASNRSLKGLIESGDLDDYLPYNMRLESNSANDDAFDSTEAYDYLADKIRNGESVLPYEVEEEVKANQYYQEVEATAQDVLDDFAKNFNEDEINAELQIAGTNEREAFTDVQVFNTDSENGDTGSGERGTAATETNPSQQAQVTDLLGDNTTAKQAIADAERAKDDKRNSGNDNQDTFTLTGSNSEADQASAAGAQDLFSAPIKQQSNTEASTGADVAENTANQSSNGQANDEVAKAAEALTAAGVKGKEKLDTIKDVREGKVTADEVADAYAEQPAKEDKPQTPLSLYDNAMDEYGQGAANVDDYKSAFNYVLNNEKAITEYLEANFTKQQLFKRARGSLESRYKSEKKDRVVRALYGDMVADFLLPSESGMTSFSHGFGDDRYKDVIKQVEAITQESLDKAMDKQKQSIEKRAKAIEARNVGMQDPKTLDDYVSLLRSKMADGMSLQEARMSLTQEQRETYDLLSAETTMAARADRKETQQDTVRTAGQTVEGNIIETKHTKKGYDLFVVQLAERVSKEDYDTLNTGAKKLGGYYSSFKGQGAVVGFQFTSRENAEAFVQLAGGDSTSAKEQVKERRDAYEDDKSQTAVERLTEMADRLEDSANEDLSRDRKTNTSRRAGMAARAEAVASAQKAMAITMRNIANSIDTGKAKFLGKVRQKVQVELLQTIVANAQYKKLREQYPSYSEYEKHQHEPADKLTADYADFPHYTLNRSDWARLGRAMVDVDGFKALGTKILSVADDVTAEYLKFAKDNLTKVAMYRSQSGALSSFGTKKEAEYAISRSGFNGQAIALQVKRGEYLIIDSPQLAKERGNWVGDDDKRISLSADFINQVIEKVGKANRKSSKIALPWQLESAYDRRNKLKRMGIETPAELRAAIREFVQIKENVEPPSKVKELERKMVGRKSDGLDFFPTPASTSDEMIETADIREGMTVLEPSAGMGHIAERIRDAGFEPDVVEFSGDRRELLELKGFNVVGSDFLGVTEKYDRIIMNPPFSNRRDEEHVRHAYNLLKPNGKLVAIMGEGVFFGNDKRATDFRDWLESVGGTSEKLEEGTFKDASLPVNTGVNARMVVIEKQEAENGTDSDNVPMFSRVDGVAKGLPKEAIQRAVNVLRRNWKNAPEIIVVQDMSDPAIRKAVRDENQRQLSQGAEGQPEGFFDSGRVYIVADEMKSPDDVARVVFHETLGHYGLRGVYGDKLDRVLDSVYMARRPLVLAKAAQYGLDFTKERDRRIAAEEVLAEMAQTNPKAGFVQRAIAAIRQFLRDIGVKLELTDNDIIANYLVPARNYVTQGAQQRGLVGNLSTAFNRDNSTTTAQLFKELTLNDDMFKYGKSDAKDLQQVFDDVAPELVKVEKSNIKDDDIQDFYNIYPIDNDGNVKRNQPGQIMIYKDGKVEINVLQWDEGYGGSGVYSALGNWAYNNGKVFAGDREGITPVGKLRRLENMISLALKFGTTDHIAPHPEQMDELEFDWHEGDTEYNLGQLLEASYNAIRNGVYVTEETNGFKTTQKSPNAEGVAKLDDLVYDFDKQQFIELSSGQPYTDEKFRVLEKSRNARAVVAGRTTLKRAAIAHTFIRAQSRAERERLLELIGKLAFQRLGGTQLDEIFYSRSNQSQTDTPQFKAWFGDSLVTDNGKPMSEGGNPLVVYHGTGADFTKFNTRQGAGGELGAGAYFTPSKDAGSVYAEGGEIGDIRNGANVMPVYLSISNPFDATNVDSIPSRKSLIKQGYDGIVDSSAGGGTQYVAFHPQQIKSAIGNNGDFNPNNPDIRFSRSTPQQSSLAPQWQSPAESKIDSTFPPDETKSQAAQRIIQDKFNRFKVLQDWVKSQGVDLSEQADVYLAETSMTGRTSVRKEDFREDVVEPLVKKTQVSNISMEEIGEFLKAQHAPEANKRAREIQGNADATAYGVSDADAKTAMGEFESLPYFAQLKEIANEWRDITNATKKIKLESGLLTDEMVKAWEETYDVYIPVKGNDEGGAKQGTGKGLNVRDKNKMRLGHGLRDEAIIENILRDHETAITLDEKNRVGKALIKFALEVNNDNIITIDRPVKRKVLKKGETAYVVAYQGLDIASFDTAKEANLYIQAQSALGRTRSDFSIETTQDPVRVMLQASPQLADNEVTVYVAGHAVRLQINDEIAAREYKNMGVEHLNTILSAGREVNNWLSKAYTGYSPDFIFTNPIRDAIQGAITLTGNEGIVMAGKIFANYPFAVKELVKHFKDKKSSDLVNEYRANGGSTGAAYLSDLERIGNDIQASYNEYQGALQTYKSTYETLIDKGRSKKAAHTMALLKAGAAGLKKIPVIGHFLKLMESLNAITENALRVATYKTLRDNGTSKLKAAAQAKNLMNFNRKGEQSNAAGALYLFFNPSVQGTQLIYEALTNSPHKREAQMLAGSMALTAFTLAMMALNGDDEDKEKWEKTPDYIKDGNIVFNMFGVQFTLTLPYGYRVFWGLGNVMADATQKNADYSKLGIRLASSTFANFSPMGNPMEGQNGVFQVLPTSAKMALAPGVNEDGFGMPITPKKWKESTPDSQLMNRGTVGSFYDGVSSKLNSLTGGSKYEAGLVDVSPETLKFWVRSLTGGAGQFVFDSTDILSSAAQGVAPQDPRNIPIVRRFVRTGGVSDARSAFWEIKNEADIANEQLKSAIKDHDRDAISDLRDRKGILARMANVSDRMLKMANAKRNAAAKIKQDQSLSLKEKQELMMGLEKEEAEIYDRFIRLYSDRISK